MKPKHEGGYTSRHAELCEQALVTLLRGLGPWKESLCLVGGLVPRYLIGRPVGAATAVPPHAGTTDVDIVIDFEMIATVDAYRRLEENFKSIGFRRGTNELGNPQHHSWRMDIEKGLVVVVDLLCDIPEGGSRVAPVPGERALSAIRIPGAQLALHDHIEVEITVEMLGGRGVATERINVANVVPFVVLKALAYDDRCEQKDAYDIVYCMRYYGNRGPDDVAAAFGFRLDHDPAPLIDRAVDILRNRFASDRRTPGYQKDGPVSYATFLTRPDQPDRDIRHRREAAAVIERFLELLPGEEG